MRNKWTLVLVISTKINLMINLDTAGQSVPILLSQNTSQLGVSVFNHVNVNVTNLYNTYA